MSLSAMYSAISGLQSDSDWLDVIGNNISNMSTVGYKSSRVEFADRFSQLLFGGTADNPSTNLGGINATQIGTGVRVASIETLFSQGEDQITGNPLDISIQGSGFFLSKQGTQTYLTRAGNLTFDSNGFLTDPNGGLIQGFTATTKYSREVINSQSSVPGLPAVVTSAALALDNTDMSSIGNIQINPQMVLPPKATTRIDFQGNLDSFQQATQPGGILDLTPGGRPLLPIGALYYNFFYPPLNGLPLNWAIDTTRMTLQPLPGNGIALKQLTNLSIPAPGLNAPNPLENFFANLGDIKLMGAGGSFAWDQQPPVPPADQTTETVYDSLGNQRQVTFQFYQVNDLGAGGVNNPAGPCQACYAWYAFETTGGQKPSTNNLLGGTGIAEGNGSFAAYDRGNFNTGYIGDFLWFNTDGSLGNTGGLLGPSAPAGTPNFESIPRIYLPGENTNPPISPVPQDGSENVAIDINFGTPGLLGEGRRDGLYSDAEGSYQVVNGTNTYIPKSTAFIASQNGYSDGMLESLNFEKTGVLQGSFSNGQRIDLAQVILAQVDNPDGLNKVGSNYYTSSPNSGSMRLGLADQNGLGTVQGNSLEGSNVDLGVELTNMIVAQRSFDTNSRVISAISETLNVLAHLGLS